jgi:uncharacterized protein (DUF305 family)
MIRRSIVSALLVVTLLLSACGAVQQSAAPGATSAASVPSAAVAPTTTQTAPAVVGTTTSMDHGGMTATAVPEATATGMDHGGMMAGESNAPYDAQFIDSMIEHHEGAIAMANQALQEASRPELKTLAQAIVTAQEAEVKQLQDWRTSWYPDLTDTGGMGMDMGDMDVSGDANVPFDQRFITAMIAHHEGAIAMAKDAQQKAEHSEIKTLAQNIISAQESEITQMQQWQQEWFGQ